DVVRTYFSGPAMKRKPQERTDYNGRMDGNFASGHPRNDPTSSYMSSFDGYDHLHVPSLWTLLGRLTLAILLAAKKWKPSRRLIEESDNVQVSLP
ncbi:hypothetical protein THAOC_34261, partial [Thalassiosira oceanica]